MGKTLKEDDREARARAAETIAIGTSDFDTLKLVIDSMGEALTDDEEASRTNAALVIAIVAREVAVPKKVLDGLGVALRDNVKLVRINAALDALERLWASAMILGTCSTPSRRPSRVMIRMFGLSLPRPLGRLLGRQISL